MALSIRLIHTWFRGPYFREYFQFVHINKTVPGPFSATLIPAAGRTGGLLPTGQRSISDRMLVFSILDRFSTLVASWARRFGLTDNDIQIFVPFLPGEVSLFKILAKPLRDTMGVLNSWEKLLMKSERKSSGILQFLGHAVEALGQFDELLVQIQVDAHLEVAVGQLVDGRDQLAHGL